VTGAIVLDPRFIGDLSFGKFMKFTAGLMETTGGAGRSMRQNEIGITDFVQTSSRLRILEII